MKHKLAIIMESSRETNKRIFDSISKVAINQGMRSFLRSYNFTLIRTSANGFRKKSAALL
jgi:hypothetical protein